jgi:hypothetical protein
LGYIRQKQGRSVSEAGFSTNTPKIKISMFDLVLALHDPTYRTLELY